MRTAWFGAALYLAGTAVFPGGLARADTQDFFKLLNSQPTQVRKAVVCFRFWHIAGAVLELGFNDEVRAQNQERASQVVKSLFQTELRILFLTKLAKQEHLKALSDEGYKAGPGVDPRTEKDRLDPDCTKGVNAILMDLITHPCWPALKIDELS